MDNKKIVTTAEKVQALAMLLIGVIFFGLGTSYFQERFTYRVPRILIPVFDYFGNIGLAVGMLILGGAVIAYGFYKWKKFSGNKSVYLLLTAIGLLVSTVLSNIDFRNKSTESSADFYERMDKERQKQIEDARNSKKPNFKNQDLEKNLAAFDDLYKRYQQSLQAKDTAAVADCEQKYTEFSGKIYEFFPKLNNDEKYELSKYMTKLAIQWNDLRTEKQ